jgi:hypothetical protein
MQYNFTGDAIAISGSASSLHGIYTISLDGQQQTLDASSSANSTTFHANVSGTSHFFFFETLVTEKAVTAVLVSEYPSSLWVRQID